MPFGLQLALPFGLVAMPPLVDLLMSNSPSASGSSSSSVSSSSSESESSGSSSVSSNELQGGMDSELDATPAAFLWPDVYPEIVGKSPEEVRSAFLRPLRLVTGCSGAGTPAHVFEKIFSRAGFVEDLAADSDRRIRKFLKENYNPKHVLGDVKFALGAEAGYCDVCGCTHVYEKSVEEGG